MRILPSTFVVATVMLGVAPSFAQLPKGIVRERDVVLAAFEDEMAEVAKLTPHLAINIEGHTAPIRAMAFSPNSQQFYTAGMDKVVHVWTLPGDDAFMPKAIVRERNGWQKSDTIRWEIARGLRGSINTLAVSPHGDQLAIAGFGARGSLGEVIWVDVDDGAFERSDYEGHRDSVVSMAYSRDGRWMVSCDLNGGVQLHDMTIDAPSKRIHYDGLSTLIRPVAFSGNSDVIIVHAAGGVRARKPDGSVVEVPSFELQRYGIAQRRVVGQLSPVHYEYVSALAATSDGRWAASADGGRNLYLHSLAGLEPKHWPLAKGHVVISLAFSGDGQYLAAGTMGESGREPPQIQIWNTATRKLVFAETTSRGVNAVAYSPNGRWLAHTGGESHHVFIREIADGQPTKRPSVLAGGERITRVAVIDRAGGFQTLFETSSGATRSFDPAALDARPLTNGPPRVRTISNEAFAGPWTVDVSPDRSTLRLRQRGIARGVIRLDPSWHGQITNSQAWCFVGDEDGHPLGIAIGTDVQSGVFVYDLALAGECNLLRYYRGHNDQVTSLSATRDGRYLVSGSGDGTIRYWKLAGLEGRAVPRRWGAELGVTEGKGLQVTKVVDTGPLYHKGVRDGDFIEKIFWTERGKDGRPEIFSTQDPVRMYGQLQVLPWYTQVTFLTRRGDERLPVFNLVAGWNHLLAVYPYGDDWIVWHPAGFYTCSPGGERLVGWHVNRDQGTAPKLYPAVRFNKILFKPDEMQNLLARGGIEQPEQQIFQPPAPPIVEILEPTERKVSLKKGVITVRARAKAQGREPITAMRLLLNGVEAPQYTKAIERVRLVSSGSDWVEREWTVPLVSGQHTIAVRADAGDLYDISPGIIANFEVEKAKRTLHLLVIGINDYQHADVSDLAFAVSDGARVEKIFTSKAKPIYDDVQVTHVRDSQASRENILVAMHDVVERVTMNDLVVLFYSGHGVRTDDDQFYFVTHDAALATIREKGLSGDDLKGFCKALGAKSTKALLLIDACHSGAMKLDDLTRELGREEYNVAMMASSRGSQVSWEDASFGGGAFTQALHLGLFDGEAETPFAKDGVVDSKELGNFVELVVNIRLIHAIEENLRRKYPIEKFPQFYTDGAIEQTPVSNFTSLERIRLTAVGE